MKNILSQQFKKLALLLVLTIVFKSGFSQWNPQALGLTATGRATVGIDVVDANTVWTIVKDNSGATHPKEFALTTNGGASWTQGVISTAPGTYDFSNISAIDSDRAWVAMYNATGVGSGIYHTSNGGVNWSQQGTGVVFNGSSSFANVVHFWNANTGFAMGDPEGGYFEIYTTTNGGNTWVRVPQANIPAPLSGETGTTGKYFVVGSTVWFSTTQGRVFKSTDFGLHWTASTVTTLVLQNLAFRDANNGLVMFNNGLVSKTTDGGTTWTSVAQSTTHDAEFINVIPNTHVYISCGSMGYFYSIDEGSTWTMIDNIPHPAASDWHDAETGWAGAINSGPSNGIYKYSGSFASPINGMVTQVIGYTNYQLQTNASMSSRLVNNIDGTLSAAWTMSNVNDGVYSDRGTGYNYFDGATWGAPPTTRIESVRTGFTNIAVTGTNGEVVICHDGAGLHTSTRSTKGTGAWLESTFNGADTWPKIAVGGASNTSIHVVSVANGLSGSPFNGQTSAIFYSRSQNGGITWDITQQVISQIDATNYLGFNAENYSIDANGNTIAIVLGKMQTDAILLKSIDNGVTWIKTIIKQFPIPMYDQATMNTDLDTDGFGDQIETTNGSFSVLVDGTGKVHVWYGLATVIEEPGASALGYYPQLGGIMYWNDNMTPGFPVKIADFVDLNNDGVPNYSDVGNYVSNTSCSHPSSGVDASGNLYLVYSAMYDGKSDGGAVAVGKNFRHSLITRSTDGGTTWCTPLDITAPETNTGFYDYREGVFAAMAKRVDNNVHLLVQTDNSPGNGLSTAADVQANNALATMYYYKIPVGSFCTPVAVTLGATQTTTDVSCLGGNNGTSTLSAYGGTGPYTYLWNTNPPVTDSIVSNLSAGVYSCTITDALNQTFVETIIIDEPLSLSMSGNITNAVCGANNGSVSLSVSGGTPPYSYAWSNGPTTNTLSGIAPGSYSVTVTDSHGCTISSSYEVQQIPANFNIDFSANPQTGTAPITIAFNNLTPSMGSYNFTWFFGDGNNMVSNNGTVFNNYGFAGLYDVSLVAVNTVTGCSDTLTKTGYVFITGAGCSHTASISPSVPASACEGDTITLTASTNAVSPYSYVWNINGTVISGQTSDTLNVTQSGYYSVTIVKNGCPKTSNATQITFNTNPIVPQITATGAIQSCFGGVVTLTASLISGVNYTWSNLETTQSISVGSAGNYYVTVTYPSNGCSSVSNPIAVNNSTQTQDICLVTVDSLSNHNIVIWNKPATGAIDSFRVYRRITTNSYLYLASLAYEDSSMYHDYAADPNVTQWAYKISVIDTCGVESGLSEHHYTMHLQLLGNGNMQWTHYEIENQPNPVSYYEIYRDDLNDGNWALLSGSIPGTNSTFTDVDYATYTDANYRVEIVWVQTCESTFRLLGNNDIQTTIVKSKSNIKTNRLIGIADAKKITSQIKVYPNPASEVVNVVMPKHVLEAELWIENMVGQVLYSAHTTSEKFTIRTDAFRSGVYFVKVKTLTGTCVEKLIIE